MRRILIVGAGQSGLQLGMSLLDHDYDVTLLSAKTPDEIRNTRVMSTPCMFGQALQNERDYKLNLWEDAATPVEGMEVSVTGPDSQPALNFASTLDNYAQTVDQRVKMSGWMEHFEDLGGKLVFHGATTADVNSLAAMYDLVIVAAGKSELVQLFDRDAERSRYSAPQRILSAAYVHGLAPHPNHDWVCLGFTSIPGVGELFTIPAYTLSGACDILFFEGVPGGPLDCWKDRPTPRQHLDRITDFMRQYVPWEYERCGEVELTDSRATLTASFPPIVRHPVGELPSGRPVLGMADVVVANDPITGQGANNASKCATSYLGSVLERGDQPFDREWMQGAFDRYWSSAQYATQWTNTMLEPPQHVQKLLGAAPTNPEIARRFVNGFNDPSELRHWFLDKTKAAEYLASF